MMNKAMKSTAERPGKGSWEVRPMEPTRVNATEERLQMVEPTRQIETNISLANDQSCTGYEENCEEHRRQC